LIPVGPRYGAVHHEAERFYLRLCPFVAKNDGHFGDAHLLGGLGSKMAINDSSIAAGENRYLESELPNTTAHSIHGGVVLTRIAGAEDQPVDRPNLNFRRLW